MMERNKNTICDTMRYWRKSIKKQVETQKATYLSNKTLGMGDIGEAIDVCFVFVFC